MVLAFQRLAAKKRTIGSKVLQELAALIGLRQEGLSEVADLFDAALQSSRAIPFAVADLVAKSALPGRTPKFWPGGWPIASWRKSSAGRVVWHC